MPVINARIGRGIARCGDRDGALPLLRSANDDLFAGGQFGQCTATTALWWGTSWPTAMSRCARKPRPRSTAWRPRQSRRLGDSEVTLLGLRALLARAKGDDTAYRDYRDRYRAMATSLGFEGHMKWAEAMP